MTTTGSIIVNQHGVRVMNESIAAAEQIPIYQAQDNGALYLVMNQSGFELMRNQGGTTSWGSISYTPEEVDAWVASDEAYPIFEKADTIEAAAAAVGIDGAALAATIAHYNEMVEAGVDADFGNTVTEKIECPIYILEMRLKHAKTLGGLAANGQLQLIDANGNAIPNLYGAGELVSGAQGHTETGMLTWCLASGYAVAGFVDAAME